MSLKKIKTVNGQIVKKESQRDRFTKFLLCVSSLAWPIYQQVNGTIIMVDESEVKIVQRINSIAQNMKADMLPHDGTPDDLAVEFVFFAASQLLGNNTTSFPRWLDYGFICKNFDIR